MPYKKVFIAVFGLFVSICSLKAQTEEYKQALELIVNSNEYTSITKNKKKYHVSNEVILFSKLGKFYEEELKKYTPLTYEEVAQNARKENSTMALDSLNKKKFARAQIYFSEIKGDIFFAELIESKKVVPYSERPNFGISQMYMFKIDNGKVTLLETREITYN